MWRRGFYSSERESVTSYDPAANILLTSFGGQEAALQQKAKSEASRLTTDGKVIAEDAKAGAETIVGQAKQKAGELKEKVVK